MSESVSDVGETEEERLAREHAEVRRARTGDPERGMRMASKHMVHPAMNPHAAPSAYADPRPRPSIAYDPLKDAEPEIVVEGDEEIVDDSNSEAT